MKSRKPVPIVLCLLAAAAVACGGSEPAAPAQEGLVLPLGEAEDGRQAFLELRCNTCHTVAGDDEMAAPVSASRGPEIGPGQADRSRAWIADSIISPSHDLPPLSDSMISPMGSYREAMTVQQLVDIVAFVADRGER